MAPVSWAGLSCGDCTCGHLELIMMTGLSSKAVRSTSCEHALDKYLVGGVSSGEY